MKKKQIRRLKKAARVLAVGLSAVAVEAVGNVMGDVLETRVRSIRKLVRAKS